MKTTPEKQKQKIREKPCYLLLPEDTLLEKANKAGEIIKHCNLCPRSCGIDRSKGERGVCAQSSRAAVSTALAHFGEEPCLTGENGSGTIFFRGCTMKCLYCQNYQISQEKTENQYLNPAELCGIFEKLHTKNVHNINLVTPEPHIYAILESLLLARRYNLNLPIIFNTNSYLTAHTADLLEGCIDIYLADLKYSSEEYAFRYSGTKDYVKKSREAFSRMYAQQNRIIRDSEGLLKKGCIARILFLPNELEGAKDTIKWLASQGFTDIYLSLMTQYSPQYKAEKHPELCGYPDFRKIENIINKTIDMGFKHIYTQSTESSISWLPDFNDSEIFSKKD